MKLHEVFDEAYEAGVQDRKHSDRFFTSERHTTKTTPVTVQGDPDRQALEVAFKDEAIAAGIPAGSPALYEQFVEDSLTTPMTLEQVKVITLAQEAGVELGEDALGTDRSYTYNKVEKIKEVPRICCVTEPGAPSTKQDIWTEYGEYVISKEETIYE